MFCPGQRAGISFLVSKLIRMWGVRGSTWQPFARTMDMEAREESDQLYATRRDSLALWRALRLTRMMLSSSHTDATLRSCLASSDSSAICKTLSTRQTIRMTVLHTNSCPISLCLCDLIVKIMVLITHVA